MEEAVRWNIKVSKDTDLALRTFLGARGMRKGDLSKFIEEAVRVQVFHRTVQDIKTRNASTDPDELQSIIDTAVKEVRSKRTDAERAALHEAAARLQESMTAAGVTEEEIMNDSKQLRANRHR